jgi:pimeloyl-ACP methyl ester carboxylesterase
MQLKSRKAHHSRAEWDIRDIRHTDGSGKRLMTNPTTFENFAALEVQVQETRIFLRRFGTGPAVLLLHGFPQTHLVWRSVAPLLARRFTVVCADFAATAAAGARPLRRTMRRMRNGRWQATWFL